MSPRAVLAGVGLVFVAAGALILTLGAHDPRERSGTVVHRGPIASLSVVDSQKMGRLATLRIEGVDKDFVRTDLARAAGVEERLVALHGAGAEVALTSVDLRRVDPAVPAAVLELRAGDELVLEDAMWDGPLRGVLRVAAPAAGGLGLLVGLGLLALALRGAPR